MGQWNTSTKTRHGHDCSRAHSWSMTNPRSCARPTRAWQIQSGPWVELLQTPLWSCQRVVPCTSLKSACVRSQAARRIRCLAATSTSKKAPFSETAAHQLCTNGDICRTNVVHDHECVSTSKHKPTKTAHSMLCNVGVFYAHPAEQSSPEESSPSAAEPYGNSC